MMLALCAMTLVGTTLAQNALLSFVQAQNLQTLKQNCSQSDIKNLASFRKPGESFSCTEGDMQWECIVKTTGYSCYLDVKTSPAPSGIVVTARSLGATVSASSSYGPSSYGEYSLENGKINSPLCWHGTSEYNQWYQYSFSAAVSVVEILSQGCAKGGDRA